MNHVCGDAEVENNENPLSHFLQLSNNLNDDIWRQTHVSLRLLKTQRSDLKTSNCDVGSVAVIVG